MEIWKYENIEMWKYGNMEIWKFGNMEIGKYGNMEVGKYGSGEIGKYGNKNIGKFGNMNIGKFGNMEILKYRNMEIGKIGNKLCKEITPDMSSTLVLRTPPLTPWRTLWRHQEDGVDLRPNTVHCQGFEALWKIFFLQRKVNLGGRRSLPCSSHANLQIL